MFSYIRSKTTPCPTRSHIYKTCVPRSPAYSWRPTHYIPCAHHYQELAMYSWPTTSTATTLWLSTVRKLAAVATKQKHIVLSFLEVYWILLENIGDVLENIGNVRNMLQEIGNILENNGNVLENIGNLLKTIENILEIFWNLFTACNLFDISTQADWR